jgi:hypothetical protein
MADDLLGEKLSDVVKRLQQRRADAALHPSRNFPVEPVEQTADQRRQQNVRGYADYFFNHKTPPITTQIMMISTAAAKIWLYRIMRSAWMKSSK